MAKCDGFERLGQRADLVDLDQDRVGAALFDARGQTFGVGDEQVVADKLALAADCVGQYLPAVPVIFGQAVFEADDRVLLDPLGPVARPSALPEIWFFGSDLKNLYFLLCL